MSRNMSNTSGIMKQTNQSADIYSNFKNTSSGLRLSNSFTTSQLM